MGIPEIQEIGKIVAQAGGTAREVFIWYMAKDIFESLLVAGVISGTVYSVYRLLRQSANTIKIIRAYDGTDCMTDTDCAQIVAIIKESKKSR